MPKSSLYQIVEHFTAHGVEFMMIGGQAEALMGSSRVTYDFDLCYRRTPENLQRLADALKELKPTLRGAPPDVPVVLDACALALGNNFTLETSIGSLDLLGHVEPIGDYENLIKSAEEFSLDELRVKTIGLEDLIRIKERIARPKDRDSLLQLLAIRRVRSECSDPPEAR
jgi:predicted nucleotidyltransferase